METRILQNEDLRSAAPSVFAEKPWSGRSGLYKFVPTIKVVDALRDAGFLPVKANQSRCLVPGKRDFVRHVVRFRRTGEDVKVGGVVPEVVLMNSHDGTSCYRMMLGLFRLVCSNGLVVADATLESVRVRHVGGGDLCSEVIDMSRKIVAEAPKTLETVARWEKLELSGPEQMAYAKSAIEVYGSMMELTPERVLLPRRFEDKGNGTRSLWKTYNSAQENLVKGGILGRSSNGSYRRTRELKSVDKDVKLNKALWVLAEEMAKPKAGK